MSAPARKKADSILAARFSFLMEFLLYFSRNELQEPFVLRAGEGFWVTRRTAPAKPRVSPSKESNL
jgi:hypothetical protein